MKDPQGCGLLVDCPRSYSLESVNVSAELWNPSNATHARTLATRERQAISRCKGSRGKLASGAWCLPRMTGEEASQRKIRLANGHSYTLPPQHVEADAVIVDVLRQLHVKQESGRTLSLNDFGAGVGQCACRAIIPKNCARPDIAFARYSHCHWIARLLVVQTGTSCNRWSLT